MNKDARPTPGSSADSSPGKARGRNRLFRAAKAILGVALLATLLIWNDNGAKLIDVLQGFKVEYALALLVIVIGTNAISSLKWGLFLAARGYRPSFWRLFELYLIGRFFSNFLPSMFGGDAARAYLLGRQISSYSASTASIFLERASGMVGLVLLALAGCLLNPALLGNTIVAVALTLSTVMTLVIVASFFRPEVFRLPIPAASGPKALDGVVRKLRSLMNEIGHYRTDHRLLMVSLAYSFAFHFLAVVNVFVACRAIGFEADFLDILVVTPIILLLSMIPVSPNNIGWWEWCFSILLASIGASSAEGLAVALILRAFTLLMSLVGGLSLLLRPGAAP